MAKFEVGQTVFWKSGFRWLTITKVHEHIPLVRPAQYVAHGDVADYVVEEHELTDALPPKPVLTVTAEAEEIENAGREYGVPLSWRCFSLPHGARNVRCTYQIER